MPGLAGYGIGLGQLGFDRAHAAMWQAMTLGTFRAPVQFRRVSGVNRKPTSRWQRLHRLSRLGLPFAADVLLGLAVAHGQGDLDYETRDVTKGDVDITLTSVLPYAPWGPRPGLGIWGLFGAGWGDLDLKDEAGKVETDLEMLMATVGALQEVLAWQQIDGGFEGVCVSDGTGRGDG